MALKNNLKTGFETETKKKSELDSSQNLSKIVRTLFWMMFLSTMGTLAVYYPTIPEWTFGSLLKINGFTLLIWATVTFFSALISSYSHNYLNGFKFQTKFMLLCVAFTFSVMLFVMSNHILILSASWLLMGFFMSRLIGVDADWGEAREASKFTLRYFVAGTFFLVVGLLLLAIELDTFLINEITAQINLVSNSTILIAAICLIIAAIIQSAIYPFHR